AGPARSERAPSGGLNDLDGLEAAVSPPDLIKAKLIEPFAFRAPPAPFKLEDGGSPAGRGGLGGKGGLGTHATQSQQAASWPVAGPDDLVLPLRLLPPCPFDRIDAFQRGHEASLQPFSLAAERLARLVYMQVLEEQTKGPLQEKKRDNQKGGQDASPDQPTHVRPPLGQVSGSRSGRLILEWLKPHLQVTDFPARIHRLSRT